MREVTSSQKQWILYIGIPILFIMGSILHFAYEWTGENAIVGLFVPTNESVWEHMKMVILPVIAWWSIYYFWKGDQEQIDKDAWFTGAAVSLFVSLIMIPLLFYFYTQAFGVQLLWVDIIILLIALLFGQLAGWHVYRYAKHTSFFLSVLFMILVVATFMLFTIYPPSLPIFMET